MKPVQWEPSCCMRTDRQTDRQTRYDEAKVAFRNFASARPKIENIRNVMYRYALYNF